ILEQISGIGYQHMGGKAAIDGHAEETLLDAEIFVAGKTVAALAAANPGKHRPPGADQVLRRLGADFLHDAGDLVAESEGQGHAARGVEPLASAEVGI